MNSTVYKSGDVKIINKKVLTHRGDKQISSNAWELHANNNRKISKFHKSFDNKYSFVNESGEEISLGWFKELPIGSRFIRPDTGKDARVAAYMSIEFEGDDDIIEDIVETITDKLEKVDNTAIENENPQDFNKRSDDDCNILAEANTMISVPDEVIDEVRKIVDGVEDDKSIDKDIVENGDNSNTGDISKDKPGHIQVEDPHNPVPSFNNIDFFGGTEENPDIKENIFDDGGVYETSTENKNTEESNDTDVHKSYFASAAVANPEWIKSHLPANVDSMDEHEIVYVLLDSAEDAGVDISYSDMLAIYKRIQHHTKDASGENPFDDPEEDIDGFTYENEAFASAMDLSGTPDGQRQWILNYAQRIISEHPDKAIEAEEILNEFNLSDYSDRESNNNFENRLLELMIGGDEVFARMLVKAERFFTEDELLDAAGMEKKEHADSISEAIAEDHLDEDPNYYKKSKLKDNMMNNKVITSLKFNRVKKSNYMMWSDDQISYAKDLQNSNMDMDDMINILVDDENLTGSEAEELLDVVRTGNRDFSSIANLKFAADISDEIPPASWVNQDPREQGPSSAPSLPQTEELQEDMLENNNNPDVVYDNSEGSSPSFQTTIDPADNSVKVKFMKPSENAEQTQTQAPQAQAPQAQAPQAQAPTEEVPTPPMQGESPQFSDLDGDINY